MIPCFSKKNYKGFLFNLSYSNIIDSELEKIENNNKNYYTGVTMALTCAIFGSLCNILINKCDQVRSTLLVFYAGISGIIISVLGCLVNSQETFSHLGELVVIDWLILTVISLVGILGKFISF